MSQLQPFQESNTHYSNSDQRVWCAGSSRLSLRLSEPNLARKIDWKSEDGCLTYITPVGSQLEFKALDERFVLNAISRLEKGKSPAPDKVTVDFVILSFFQLPNAH